MSTIPQYIGWGNIYRYKISILKDIQYHIRNCQLKQGDTTTYLLEWPKCKTLALPNADQHGNNRNSHLLLVGMQNDTIILDDSLLLCPRSWKLCSHRKLHTNIYRSFIHNRMWKQPRCSSVDEKNNKIWTIQTMRYYSPLQRYNYQAIKDMEEISMHISQRKSLIWKVYILHYSNYMTLWKRWNQLDSRRIHGC